MQSSRELFIPQNGSLVLESRPLKVSLAAAVAGCVHAWRHERNLRVHIAVTGLVLVAALVLRLTPLECAVLALTVGLVLGMEMMNTAIERAVDLASPEYHELAKLSKDVAAGGVALASGASVVVGLLILGAAVWRLYV